MSTPLKIQRITGLEGNAVQNLRLFCTTWKNAARLLLKVIGYTEHPEHMKDSLQNALDIYIEGKSEGLSDIDRLRLMLSETLKGACRLTPDLSPELFALWCVEHHIPRAAYIQEVRDGRHY